MRAKGNEGKYISWEILEAEVSTYKMESLRNVYYSCLGLQVNSLHKEYLRNNRNIMEELGVNGDQIP